ncbi:MAG: hypothetical protein AAFX79_06565 [Planctomycetota bacterium]
MRFLDAVLLLLGVSSPEHVRRRFKKNGRERETVVVSLDDAPSNSGDTPAHESRATPANDDGRPATPS